MSAQHSSESNEHYTPLDVIEAARLVMWEIDLDPASSDSVNLHRVKARRHFTIRGDGLQRIWRGNVWLNPPGGVHTDGRSRAAVWWDKLVDDYIEGSVTQAIFLGFSVEILAQSQDSRIWIGDTTFCVPRTRLRFEQETAPGVFVPGEQPTHANIIAYLPPRTASGHPMPWSVKDFEKQFGRFGKIRPIAWAT